MNQYDTTVGGGIQSLLQAAHENVGEPGAFNFAPKNEPVIKMADGGSAYSNEQLSQNIRDAIAQGKTFNDIVGSLSQSGVDPKQLNYVIGEMARSSSFTPQTSVGIPGTGGSLWTFIRDALKEGALTVGPMIVAPHLGAIGQGLGASAAYAPAVGGAVVGGTTAALSGKEGSDILKGAALGALSGGGGELAKTLGREAGELAGNLFTNETASSYATQLAKGAVEGGIKSLPGAIATGDAGRALTGALVGGATNVGQYAMGDSSLPFTKQQTEAGLNLIRALNSGNTLSAANAAATLINNPDITVATKAATLLKAVESGNPNAILAATQMLGNAVNKSSFVTKTAEAPGGAFETSAIIDEFGDMGGTLVSGEGGDSVNIFGTRSPDDIALDYFFSPEDTTAGQRVNVGGTRIKSEELGPFVDLFDKDRVDQRVDVSGSRIVPTLTGADLQTVGVEGSRFPIEGLDNVSDLLEVVKPTSKVDIEGQRIKPDELDDFINLMDKDLVDQRVEVAAKKLPPEETEEAKTTPPTTTSPTTRSPDPGSGAKKKTTSDSTYTPIPEAAPQQVFRPGVVTDAYEVLFGAGAPSLMGFTKAERAKQILARKGEEEENQPETAYDRLMSMAEKEPVGKVVDQLMKIIEGA